RGAGGRRLPRPARPGARGLQVGAGAREAHRGRPAGRAAAVRARADPAAQGRLNARRSRHGDGAAGQRESGAGCGRSGRRRGKVGEVRPRVDRAKATVTVKVAFVDEAKDVLPDMGAKVTFLNRQLDEAAQKASPTPAIAPDAVVDRGETKAVFVVQQNETVKSVPVVTGPPLGNLLSLREGPPPGTRVVRSPPADL